MKREQKKHQLLILAGLFFTCLLSCGVSSAAPLTVSYFERPPYYFTDTSGQPAGLLVERTHAVLQHTTLETKLIKLTPYRIMYVLRQGAVPHCSIGWFKTDDRERFAKFSEPIYRNKPLELLTFKNREHLFAGLTSLRDVFRNRQLKIARMSEFSYGDFVDGLLTELSPESLFLSLKQTELLKAVAEQKADYMLVAPEEIATLAEFAGVREERLHRVQLTDVPAGNQRYLMCSESVTDETIEQLNTAIDSLF